MCPVRPPSPCAILNAFREDNTHTMVSKRRTNTKDAKNSNVIFTVHETFGQFIRTHFLSVLKLQYKFVG